MQLTQKKYTGAELSQREAAFCYGCARLGNAREAAVRAGYPPNGAERWVARLLARPEIEQAVEQHRERLHKQSLAKLARKGLERLAFGANNDAVRLLVAGHEIAPDQWQRLDLFGVSAIKQHNGGGFEITFFDRIKVLELMLALARTQQDTQNNSFWQALEEGARQLDRVEESRGAV